MPGIARRNPDLVRKVLPSALPWVRFLPTADVDTMSDEFVATTEAAAAVGNTTPVSQLLVEWRHTAEIHADPDLYRALTGPRDDFGPVARQ
ncbi:hypothetical protein Pen02_48830 [Plantactinospora endophytica]|uniref:Uncharacterized protein n=1 Tax=Plantactinospora endophytica TaxID=673535 RepID=A0ABQ4E5H8_9ACTN|nr:hypothetical protein Pen02_48830 [Plantactinospora endophytica]